jgi:hypothetical protein
MGHRWRARVGLVRASRGGSHETNQAGGHSESSMPSGVGVLVSGWTLGEAHEVSGREG